jgi:hypothetical protein
MTIGRNLLLSWLVLSFLTTGLFLPISSHAQSLKKVRKAISVADVVDYGFLDKARKELGLTK